MKLISRLEFKFPQLLFCTYLQEVPEGIELSEVGFWLLNHARIDGAGACRPNENAVLILVDPQRKEMGMSLGYRAEALLKEDRMLRLLADARSALIHEEYGKAIEQVFLRVGKDLKKRAARCVACPPSSLSRPSNHRTHRS